MKVIAINGSPRKKWNTATLLGHALEGAALKGAGKLWGPISLAPFGVGPHILRFLKQRC